MSYLPLFWNGLLRRDRPYERLNIAGIKGLTEAQKEALRVLGAIECDACDTNLRAERECWTDAEASSEAQARVV